MAESTPRESLLPLLLPSIDFVKRQGRPRVIAIEWLEPDFRIYLEFKDDVSHVSNARYVSERRKIL